MLKRVVKWAKTQTIFQPWTKHFIIIVIIIIIIIIIVVVVVVVVLLCCVWFFLLCEGNCSLFKLLPILPTFRGNFAGEPSDA